MKRTHNALFLAMTGELYHSMRICLIIMQSIQRKYEST
jgi:hypothetical protein